MKNYSVYLLIILFVFSTFNIKAQTQEEYFKTLQKRVNTTGESPSQTRYNLYTDKMNKLFYDEQWKDEVISMKQIKVEPVDNPSNWYYLISVKTKNCSTPWYIEHNTGDPTLGEILRIIGAPAEYNNFIKEKNKPTEAETKAADEEKTKYENQKKIDIIWVQKIQPNISPYINDTLWKIINNSVKEKITAAISELQGDQRTIANNKLVNMIKNSQRNADFRSFLNEYGSDYNGYRRGIFESDYLKKYDEDVAVQKFSEWWKADLKKEADKFLEDVEQGINAH